MRRCDYPGCEEELSLPFKCKLCGQYFCAKHRLPEQHNCPKLAYFSSDEYKKIKVAPLLGTKQKEKKEQEKKKIRKKEIKVNDYYYSKRDKAQTAAYLPASKDRFLVRSPFFTLFAFPNNWLNILIVSVGIGLILTLNTLVYNFLFTAAHLNWNATLWSMLVTFIAATTILGGQHSIQYIYAKNHDLDTKTVIWIQGALFSLFGIIIPFIFIPAYIVFQDLNRFEEKAKSSIIGIFWLMGGIIISGIILTIKTISTPILFGLSNIPIFFFWYLAFLLIPFGITNGNYILMWNKKWLFGLIIANFVILIVFSIIRALI